MEKINLDKLQTQIPLLALNDLAANKKLLTGKLLNRQKSSNSRKLATSANSKIQKPPIRGQGLFS